MKKQTTMPKMLKKAEAIRRDFVKGLTITDLYARNNYQFTRLASLVGKLKERGWEIDNLVPLGGNRYAKYKCLKVGNHKGKKYQTK